MRPKKRKIIIRLISYFITTVLFLIVTISLILWALGYRVDIKNYKISQTGILTLKTNQSSFDVFIDDKKFSSNDNEIVIKSLLPCDYLAKIEKKGFNLWSKNLTIKSQEVTRQENIILFSKSLKKEKILDDISNYKITSDKSIIVATGEQKNKLQKINLKSKKVSREIKLANIQYFEPNFKGNRILIKQGYPEEKFITIDLDKKGKINELSRETDKFGQLKWLSKNDQILFLVYNNSLYRTNVDDQPVVFNLLRPNIVDFEFSDNRIFYIQSKNGKLSLWQADFALKNQQELISNLNPADYQLIPSPDSKNLILKDIEKEIIYLVKEKKIEKISKDIKDIKWASDSKKFICHTDFEIWLLKLKNGKISKNLVSRYSEKINNLSWYSGEHHLIFSLDNKINAVEEGGTNLVELTDFQTDNQIISQIKDEEKITIFFLSKKENDQKTTTLFSLSLGKP
jgi:hypothetical protein